jgi:hypothetical protein
VYLEVGAKRVFATAADWPGWCRTGPDEDAALEALIAYGPRYRRAIGRAAQGFGPPAGPSGLQVAERLKGNATTDFGAPGVEAEGDRRPMGPAEVKRQSAILRAAWRAFDRTAERFAGARLSKGPRGGGRELEAIVRHVLEAEQAYLAALGERYRKPVSPSKVETETAEVRRVMVALIASRARGDPPPRTPRKGTLWTPRFAVRRSAWHVLDHAWEIEDRAG